MAFAENIESLSWMTVSSATVPVVFIVPALFPICPPEPIVRLTWHLGRACPARSVIDLTAFPHDAGMLVPVATSGTEIHV
jgi:hypothetical protein